MVIITNVVILILVVKTLSVSCSSCPTVNTQNGQISGTDAFINHEDGKKVCIYNAIPFAEPPIGKLRFQTPKKLTTRWDGVKDGTVPKNACLTPAGHINATYIPKRKHRIITYSEDCLNLNVYTTNVKSSAKMPVIVWLHGGWLGFGNNQQYDGSAMASLQDVVVVIPNYRVNVFGFLSLGRDSVLPGNLGLWDQIMALKWIQGNIEIFGGDPTRVTLMGEDAGGTSIGHLMNSDQAKGLFHRAIFFSGVADMIPKTVENQLQISRAFLDEVGINDTDNEVIMTKLQQLNSSVVLQSYNVLVKKQWLLSATIDGILLKKFPNDYLETVSPVPSIIFTNDHEGMGMLSKKIPGFYQGLSEENAKRLILGILKIVKPNANGTVVYELVKKHYLRQYKDDALFYSKLYGAFFGDIFFHGPGFQAAVKYSEKTNVYYGYGSYQLQAFHNESYSDGIPLKPDWVNCDHADDLLVSLGMPFLDYEIYGDLKFTEEEEKLSELMMAYLANFARCGDPNGRVEELPFWPKFTVDEPYVFKFAIPDVSVESNVYMNVMDLWSQNFTCGLVEFTGSNIVGFNDTSIMVDPGFVDALNRLNEYAADQKLTVVVVQPFKKCGKKPDKSSTVVGHAVGVKFKLRRRNLCGRKCMEGSKGAKAQKFISNLRFNTGLRWVSDSKLHSELLEIDDELDIINPDKWDKLYASHQNYC